MDPQPPPSTVSVRVWLSPMPYVSGWSASRDGVASPAAYRPLSRSATALSRSAVVAPAASVGLSHAGAPSSARASPKRSVKS